MAFLRASMVVIYYIKLFRMEVDRHNAILMSFLLLQNNLQWFQYSGQNQETFV